jgi:hypothetical protein
VIPYSNDTIAQLSGLHIEQNWDFFEMLSGCEKKNKYSVYSHSGQQDDDNTGALMMNIEEDSDCMERMCCKNQRACVLLVREGPAATKGGMGEGDVVMQFHKSFGMPQCCCMRPEMQIFDGQANKIGAIEDPFACCQMDQKIYAPDGEQIYGATGSLCQAGIYFPCCGAKNATFCAIYI